MNKRLSTLAIALAALSVCQFAHAINKCMTPEGFVLITDEPCPDADKKGAPQAVNTMLAPSQPARAAAGAATPGPKPVQTPKSAQAVGRAGEITGDLAKADKEIADMKQQLDQALTGLRARRPGASKTRPGASPENVMDEIKNVTAGYESRINMVEERKRRLAMELASLKPKD